MHIRGMSGLCRKKLSDVHCTPLCPPGGCLQTAPGLACSLPLLLTYSSNNPYPFPPLFLTVPTNCSCHYLLASSAHIDTRLQFKFFRRSNLALEELVLIAGSLIPSKFLPKGRRAVENAISIPKAPMLCRWEWEHIMLSCRSSSKEIFS